MQSHERHKTACAKNAVEVQTADRATTIPLDPGTTVATMMTTIVAQGDQSLPTKTDDTAATKAAAPVAVVTEAGTATKAGCSLMACDAAEVVVVRATGHRMVIVTMTTSTSRRITARMMVLTFTSI